MHNANFRAAIAAAFLLAAPASAAVLNGDFETTDGSVGLVKGSTLDTLTGNQWDVFDTIPGWTTAAGRGIEIQRGTVVTPNSGDFYIELDSHPNRTNGGSTNTEMRQNLGSLALGSYELAFYYRPRTNNALSMDIDFGVLGGGSLSDSVSFADGATGAWTRIARSFDVTSSADVILNFAAAGTADQLGGFIDDVSVKGPAPVPLPAAGVLLMAGIASLGALRKRR